MMREGIKPFPDGGVKSLPHACGVYVFRDAALQAIYVGKAVDLAKRVAQYFNPSRDDPKTALLAPLIRKIDYVACASERESLLLERRLIRRLRPFFNSMWKDDKSYPFVKISLNEDYPRILLTRKRLKDGALYFGPYPKAAVVQALLRRFRKARLFPLRPCKWSFSADRPLAEKKIKSCLYYHTRQCPAPCAGPARGRIAREDYRRIAADAARFFQGEYGELLESWRSEMQAASQRLDYEEAARLRDCIEAVEHMDERVRLAALGAPEIERRLEATRGVTELQAALALAKPPHHIEAFDISHSAGKQTAASMVCFTGGEPDKGHYRRFKIKTVAQVDDCACMKEVVARRYRRLKSEKAALPDLVLIDGGKGQLGAAVESLKELGVRIPIASLAKRLEEVFLPGKSDSVLLARSSPALQLLQRLRDEAHRFAVGYHKLLRKKRLLGPAPAATCRRARPCRTSA